MKGKVESNMINATVVVLSVFYLMAMYKVNDTSTVIFFILMFGVMHSISKKVLVSFFVALVGSIFFRAVYVMREGLASKEPKTKTTKQQVKKVLGPEGLNDMKSLMKQQEGLMQMAQNLQPLMQQASKLIEGLPDGVLENAMKKLQKK